MINEPQEASMERFVLLEQMILSGQLDAKQIDDEMRNDPEFHRWYLERAEERQCGRNL